jgi:hypothetical protein
MDMVKALDLLLDRQKRELAKGQALLAEVDEQVKGVQATREEVKTMMERDGVGRSTTPEVEPPVVEALTPPFAGEEGDQMGGLESLDPEIVALLRADMGLSKEGGVMEDSEMDEYAP